jgi:hypothetical protein
MRADARCKEFMINLPNNSPNGLVIDVLYSVAISLA